MLTVLWSVSIWSKLERWKSSITECLMSWLQKKKKKKSSFWSAVFSYSTQQLSTISWSDCDVRQKVDFIQQPAMTISVAGLRRSSKALPKANLHQEKVMVTGSLLPVWSTTAFWILVKPLPLRSMLSKLTRCSKTCNACSVHWSTERAQFFSMTMPNGMSHNQCFKSWMNWAMKFCLFRSFHLTSCQLTTTSSSILTALFLQGKHFYNQHEAENAFQEFVEFQSMSLYTTGINKYFLSAKCDNQNIIKYILINKDVFEPSYDDFKFTVQNHSYFCTNPLLSFKSPRASFLCVLLVNPVSQPSPISREGRENSTFP